MTDGLSEANREPDYSTDPMTGECNACHSIGCSFGCMKKQRDTVLHLLDLIQKCLRADDGYVDIVLEAEINEELARHNIY